MPRSHMTNPTIPSQQSAIIIRGQGKQRKQNRESSADEKEQRSRLMD